jgi:FkbM family methyltransferase
LTSLLLSPSFGAMHHSKAWIWIGLAGIGLCLAGCDGRKDILGTEKKIYSQHNEELLVRDFFQDRLDGFYVDVGAYRARAFSTTAYLDHELGWNGIAIDAQANLASEWATLRPRAKFFSYIVTDHSGGTETLYVSGPISSVKQSHKAEVDEILGLPEATRLAAERKIDVETITLNDLLDREGVTKIDFLSMDIEQGEPAALAGFDIQRFRPELVCVEAFPTVHDQLVAYFAENDYVRIEKYRDLDPNWWFKPKGAPGPD